MLYLLLFWTFNINGLNYKLVATFCRWKKLSLRISTYFTCIHSHWKTVWINANDCLLGNRYSFLDINNWNHEMPVRKKGIYEELWIRYKMKAITMLSSMKVTPFRQYALQKTENLPEADSFFPFTLQYISFQSATWWRKKVGRFSYKWLYLGIVKTWKFIFCPSSLEFSFCDLFWRTFIFLRSGFTGFWIRHFPFCCFDIISALCFWGHWKRSRTNC